jgi:hypothetical protein
VSGRLIAPGAAVVWLALAAGTAAAAGPKVALDPAVEAKAKRATIEPADLPPGWRVDRAWKRSSAITDQGATFDCHGHRADLSRLVLRGAWSSRTVRVAGNDVQQVTSAVTFLGTPAQATAEFEIAVRYYPRYCSVAGSTANGSTIDTVDPIRIRRAGAAQAGFRTVMTVRGAPFRTLVGDIVFVHEGPAVIAVLFVRTGKPFDPGLETALVQKLVHRARL